MNFSFAVFSLIKLYLILTPEFSPVTDAFQLSAELRLHQIQVSRCSSRQLAFFFHGDVLPLNHIPWKCKFHSMLYSCNSKYSTHYPQLNTTISCIASVELFIDIVSANNSYPHISRLLQIICDPFGGYTPESDSSYAQHIISKEVHNDLPVRIHCDRLHKLELCI